MILPMFLPLLASLSLATFGLTAHIPTTSAQYLATADQTSLDPANRTLSTIPRCNSPTSNLQIHYYKEGAEVKPATFNAIIWAWFNGCRRAGEIHGWDTTVGSLPLQFGKRDYWLAFFAWAKPHQTTWRDLMDIVALIQICYVRGHDEEFLAGVWDGQERIVYSKLEFDRVTEGVPTGTSGSVGRVVGSGF